MESGPSSETDSDLRSTGADLLILTPIEAESSREPWPLLSPSTRLSSVSSDPPDLTRPGNEWLRVLRQEHSRSEDDDAEPRYRVTPLLIVGDIFRIRLLTWRADTGRAFDDIHVRVHRLTANQSLDMYAVEIGADTVAPVTRQHFTQDGGRGNFFLVAVPTPFVLRISIVGSSVPDILVSLNPLLTVFDLKLAIQQARGYPTSRTDLVYKGIALNNSERLYLYNLHNGDTLKMVLHRSSFVAVHFHTFWNRMYDVDVDVTSTVSEVVAMILKKCMAGHTANYTLDECYVSANSITISNRDGRTLSPLDCVSQGLDPNKADNYLSIVEDRSSDFYVTLSINDEAGDETHTIKAAEGAKLVPVYLRLHGITNIPIDLMTLVAPGRTLNAFDNLHTQYHGKTLALLSQDIQSVQLLHTQRFDVIMPAGSTVSVFVNRGGRILDIKRALNDVGYTDARHYSISYKDGILHDERSLDRCDFKDDHNHVFLVRGEYPVDVVSVTGELRRVRLQDHTQLSILYEEGDDLYQPIRRNSQYLFCGNVIPQRRTAHRARLQPGNLVFQDRTSKDLVIEILYGSDHASNKSVSLPLHRQSIVFELRRTLANWRLSNWALEALEQAIIWRNFPRSQTEVLRSVVPTEFREDIYGVDTISDSRYRWAFAGAEPSKARTDTPNDISKRAARVRALLEINDRKPQKYIDLPPLQIHSEPVTLHYDHSEGLSSLIGYQRQRNQDIG